MDKPELKVYASNGRQRITANGQPSRLCCTMLRFPTMLKFSADTLRLLYISLFKMHIMELMIFAYALKCTRKHIALVHFARCAIVLFMSHLDKVMPAKLASSDLPRRHTNPGTREYEEIALGQSYRNGRRRMIRRTKGL
eukprot:2524952-Pleurochrysis_carterae.AAC.2